MADETKDVQKKEAESPEKGEQTRQIRIFKPAVDIIERKEDIILLADMPGVDEKSVDITLEKNELTLYGKITHDVPDKHTLYLSEYGLGDYHRVFTLAEAVDRDKIQASVKNGVLKIVLPKAEVLKTRKITVQAEA